MADINTVMLTGRLTKDVEVKEFEKSNLLTGSIAVNRSEKSGDEWKEVASFFNFKTFIKSTKQVEFLKNVLRKGAAIVLDGSLRMETWEKDGKKNSMVMIYANNIKPMGSGKSETSESVSNAPADNGGFAEDLPF